jgi:glycosidase
MEELDNIKFSIKEIKSDDRGCKYNVTIKVPMSIGFIERMKFIAENDIARHAFQLHHVVNKDNYVYFNGDFYLETSALYHFYFSFEANHKFIYYKKKNRNEYNSVSRSDMWKLSVNYKTPDWAKNAIMYHCFVDRVNRKIKKKIILPNRHLYPSFNSELKAGPDENGIWNNDFYGGDLLGIVDMLDYISSLGVSIIYLSPVVRSQSNHRYDTGDYLEVDPYAGTNDDLKKLCDEAHKRGMKVILDAVFNHTGNDSKYFNEFNNYDSVGAYQSKESPYYNFYRKHETPDKTYFDYWWGMKNLPVCDGESVDWQNYIYGVGGVIDKWFSLGIDGLRLDVADELSDRFIEGIRIAVKRNKPDGFILGEVWKDPTKMNRGYITSGKGMDSVMNYELIDALIRYFKYSDVTKLNWKLNEILRDYPDETIKTLMNFTSTHDISRIINIFASNEFNYYGEWAWNLINDDLAFCKNYKISKKDYQQAKNIYKAYVFFLTFFPGILSIFYGDELGLQGMGNLYNRQPFPIGKEVDFDLINFFREIGKIRKAEPFLGRADTNIYDVNDKYVMFERVDDDHNILVTVNRTNEEIKTPIPSFYQNSEVSYNLYGDNDEVIHPYGGLVLRKIKK